jgi:isopenicillin-N N-acyltransferase-like protein
VARVAIPAGDPRARGVAYGAAIADRLPAIWQAYEPVFRLYAGVEQSDALRTGAAALEAVGRWRPALAEELHGVAEGAGVPIEVVATLNARTELMVKPECATVGRVGVDAASPWLAQNWDWFLDAPQRCVVVTAPEFVTFTEAGILAKIGVNAAGLALSLDILNHASDRRARVGVPIHLLLREILGACATVDDVDALLRSVEVSASSCLTVVTADGNGAMFEVAPAGVARLEADADGLLSHTNSFVDPVLAAGDRVALPSPACTRHADLATIRPQTIVEGRAALASHTAEPVPVCRHGLPGPNGLPPTGTAACLVLDPTARTIDVGLGPPCTATFERFALSAAARA